MLVKGLYEIGRLPWIIQVNPKGNRMYSCKKEAEGDHTHTHTHTHTHEEESV